MIENLQDESKSKTNNVLYLGNKIDAKAMLKGGIQKNVPAFQSAMYKSPKENFSDFYNQVFEKENDAKANNTTVKKSYFQYNNNGLSVRIPHDTVIHDNNNHSLSSTEWETFLDNLQNPVDAVVSNEPRFNGTPILLKYKIGNSYYGAVIEFFNKKQPIIATAFIDKEENIDKWLKKNSHSQAKNTSSVTTKGMLLSNDYNNIISYVKQKLNPTEFAHNNIKENFGYSAEELENNFKADIKNILEENGIDYDEFEIEDIKLYGSYTTGKNKDTSDLDVIVQYKGSMREDSAFDLLNSEKLTIVDVNGIEREVDINPINSALSGTIEDHIEYMNELDPRLQSAITAGAKQNEVSDAINEWQEKGTDSKYFKKWFGDSKVVDENGKPLVVYHGSPNEFEVFNADKTLYGEVSEGFNFFTNKKSGYQDSAKDYAEFAGTNGYRRNGKVYETYLKIQKPLHIKYTNKTYWNSIENRAVNESYSTPVEYYDTNYKKIKEEFNNGNYDGIIIENTDKNNDDSILYLVQNPEQIKSVDNRGTFDESNPNIYYQSAYHGSPHKFEKFSTDFMGKGEGAQAHGWGLYFASDKNTSDNYRQKLLSPLNTKPKYEYNNTKYETIDEFGEVLDYVYNYGKEKAVKKFNDFFEMADKQLQYVKQKENNEVALLNAEIWYERTERQVKYAEEINAEKITKKEQGQLYEVDIPEDEVLLDEDLPFSEQPQKVQEALIQLFSDIDINVNEELINEEIERLEFEIEQLKNDDAYDFDYNEYKIEQKENELAKLKMQVAGINIKQKNEIGRNIYRCLSNIYNSDKEASLKLNEYGIKGIKYNGRQDGECYVIFDDKAVNILKTYYQSAMLSDVELDKKVNIVNLTSNFNHDSNLTKTDLTNYIKSLIGNRITTADKKAILTFVSRSKRVGKNNVRVPGHIVSSSKVENSLKGERNTLVNNIVDLIKNSTMIEISENKDKTLKPYVDNYIRFYVPVQINNEIFTVRIVAENNNNDNLFNIQLANVYDVIIDKKMPTHSTIKDNSPSNLIEPTSTNSINDNLKNINPTTITIREMLNGVKDADSKLYFQESNNPLDKARGFSTVRQDVFVFLQSLIF